MIRKGIIMKKSLLTISAMLGNILFLSAGSSYATAGPPDVPIVPEPASTALFIVGGAVLGYGYFRKKNK